MGADSATVQGQAMEYFLMIWPMMVSMGMGGGVLGVLYAILSYIWEQIARRMYCSVTIKYDDECFQWVQKYMQETGHIANRGNMKVMLKRNNEPWWQEIFKAKDDRKKPEVEYQAGQGTHVCRFKGKLIFANKKVTETLITGWERVQTDVEYITLTTSGTDTTILKEFIDAAIVHNMTKDTDTIGIYELHRWGLGWTKV